ncbi:MAG: FAD-dependent oxidoreductase [Chloroflexota bacterium]|jgi:alkyl hydroperoxide reductase subunit F
MYDLIIVGGGPAGLTAAIYAIRKRLDVFLISRDLGGKTNYRMELPDMEDHLVIRGVEVVDKFWRELDYLEFARRLDPVKAIHKKGEIFEVITTEGDSLQARSVILATGSRVRQLGVPGEDKFIGRGLSYSAISHAPLFLGKQTAVVGDGALALRAVNELSLVAETVNLIIRSGEILETRLARHFLGNSKVVIWEGYSVEVILGTDFAERLIVKAPDGTREELAVDGIFVELGLIPNSDMVRDLADLDEEGRVLVDNVNRTSCPGLFAAGDVTDAYAEQVLIAVGEGAKAALSAFDYLMPVL